MLDNAIQSKPIVAFQLHGQIGVSENKNIISSDDCIEITKSSDSNVIPESCLFVETTEVRTLNLPFYSSSNDNAKLLLGLSLLNQAENASEKEDLKPTQIVLDQLAIYVDASCITKNIGEPTCFSGLKKKKHSTAYELEIPKLLDKNNIRNLSIGLNDVSKLNGLQLEVTAIILVEHSKPRLN